HISVELGGSGNSSSQGSSWHYRSGNWGRPTVFTDGHAKVLKDPRYTSGDSHPTDVRNRMYQGDHNNWIFTQGEPGRRPFDFWIDEY
ncbi:MAG: hypothetical protein D6820_14655, partial [Lentisphaerae bacterium]